MAKICTYMYMLNEWSCEEMRFVAVHALSNEYQRALFAYIHSHYPVQTSRLDVMKLNSYICQQQLLTCGESTAERL